MNIRQIVALNVATGSAAGIYKLLDEGLESYILTTAFKEINTNYFRFRS